MNVTRIFDILDYAHLNYAYKTDFLANKVNGTWKKYTSCDYFQEARNLSLGLLSLGFEKGDRIASISNNRPEWNFLDMAILQCGMVHVPIYPTLSEADYEYILSHCKPKLLVVSDNGLYQRLKCIAEKGLAPTQIVSFNEIAGLTHWREISQQGKEHASEQEPVLEQIRKSVQPDDLATLIYTSGTTGNPKGVMLSHNNIMSNVRGIQQVFDFNPNDSCLSFLPISHVFERTINYYFQLAGLSTYYAENLGTLTDNLKEVQPSVFIAVPRVLERIYDRIIGVGKDLKGIKRQIFFWAVNLGLHYQFHNQNSWVYRQKLKLADRLVFNKWRQAIGGRVRTLMVGGAALQERLMRVFNAAGIPVLEGYGMTETSPVIACNVFHSGKVMPGSVGQVLPGVQVKISDDGEIMVKGDSVMMGYYEDAEHTRDAFDADDWLHTGDIGNFVGEGYLKITDRKKEMFKLSSGKYVAPQVIENKFKESFFIEQLMVVGENEKFASALISPNFQFLHNWCTRHAVSYRDNKELIAHPKVIARFQREVNLMNKQLGQTEQVKRFRLVHEEWSTNTGELSPTLKLKRRFLFEKYDSVLKEIYSVQK